MDPLVLLKQFLHSSCHHIRYCCGGSTCGTIVTVVLSTNFELSATHSHILQSHYTITTHHFNWWWISMRELCSAHWKKHDTNFLEGPTFHRHCWCVLVYPMNGIWLTDWLVGWLFLAHAIIFTLALLLLPQNKVLHRHEVYRLVNMAFCVEIRSVLRFIVVFD